MRCFEHGCNARLTPRTADLFHTSCHFYDYGEINGQFFCRNVMIDGTSLRALLKQYGPLTPARAVAIVRQIAAALMPRMPTA